MAMSFAVDSDCTGSDTNSLTLSPWPSYMTPLCPVSLIFSNIKLIIQNRSFVGIKLDNSQ